MVKVAVEKGAARVSDVSVGLKARLEAGGAETRTLMEALAMDFQTLLHAVDPHVAQVSQLDANAGVCTRMQQAAAALFAAHGESVVQKFARHPSDTVRGWAVYSLALRPAMPVQKLLQAVRPFADDPHFGVREWAWLAIRPQLALDLAESIDALVPWTQVSSANLRRFAAECLRPRGVWCSHINELKQRPSLGLSILQPLRADDSRYVQDSVANWLNDAAKTQPDWVRQLCLRWQAENSSKACAYVVKRAQRSITKV
jgi:3-methyladenine DNA glycosylase AlkC